MVSPRTRTRFSLRWRLSLLVSAVLMFVVAALVGLAHREVESALERVGRVRLQAVADQLMALLAQSTKQRLDEARRIANLPELNRYLAKPDEASRQQAADAIRRLTTQQPVWVVVWARDGSRVLELLPTAETKLPNLAAVMYPTAPSRAGLSELKSVQNVAYYDIVADVPGTAGEPPAHVAIARAFSSAAAAELITRLIGLSASIKVGNRGGSPWTDLAVVVPKPPIDTLAPAAAEYAGRDGVHLAVAAPIRDTPWSVVVDFPRAAIVAPAGAFLLRIITIALPCVLLAAAVTGWLMGRVTKPLHQLTEAAEAIASGEYSGRVATRRDDEIGRLGAAFNTMTARVEEGMQGLESRVRERTSELEIANAALRDAQEEMVRKEKLAMLGQLASGVGHELRNPLGVMTNAVYYLDMIQQDADPEVREYLGILRGQIGAADRIVTDLLDFARVKPPQIRETALERLVDEQLQRLGTVGTVEIRREFPKDLPTIWVDQGQIGQVVLNLLTNAVQAMDESGTLTLRGRTTEEGVTLEVSDTGPGIRPELQQKIFEPLFTTKARGIGLGLAVSRSLAAANQGQLAVSSLLGKGSTFSLTLPIQVGVAA